MNKILTVIFGLCLILMSADLGCAQTNPQGQTPQGNASESPKIFIIGQIRYLQSEGGYYVGADHPYRGIYKIANQNPEVLEKFLKQGDRDVNIEGRLVPGTKVLLIETLDGQPYQGSTSSK
jgi:hypothetical protein